MDKFLSSTLSASGSLKCPPLDQDENEEAFPPLPWGGGGEGGIKKKHMAGQLRDSRLQRNSVSNLSDPSLALSHMQAGGERWAQSGGSGLVARSAKVWRVLH